MERKHIVKSAKYWFDLARNPQTRTTDKVFAMEQCYNHAENAVAWLFEKATPEVKAKFLEIQK